jgi:hypothetical protein
MRLDTTTEKSHLRISPIVDVLFISYSDDDGKLLEDGLALGEVRNITHLANDHYMLWPVFGPKFSKIMNLPSLEKLTVVLHDASISCDDMWEKGPGHIAFFEPSEKMKNWWAEGQFLSPALATTLEGLKAKHPEWKMPTVQVKCMTRGCVPCKCYKYFDDVEEDDSDSHSSGGSRDN